MSVVIAIKDGDRFVLGADKQVSLGNKKSHNGQKVWLVDSANFDCCCMGGVGLARANQIIQYVKGLLDENCFNLKEGPDDSYVALALTQTIWATLAANGVKCIEGGGALGEDPGMEFKYLPNEYMFAYKDRCWIIHTDMTIEEVEDYGAIGSGETVALSALRKTEDSKMTAFERIVDAIDECAESTVYIDHNVDFIETIPMKTDIQKKMIALGYEKEDIEATLVMLGIKKPKVVAQEPAAVPEVETLEKTDEEPKATKKKAARKKKENSEDK